MCPPIQHLQGGPKAQLSLDVENRSELIEQAARYQNVIAACPIAQYYQGIFFEEHGDSANLAAQPGRDKLIQGDPFLWARRNRPKSYKARSVDSRRDTFTLDRKSTRLNS